MNLYVIFDRLAGEAGPIFELKNDALAVRAMRRMLNSKEGLNLDAGDFKLLRLGTIDRQTCVITVETVPVEVEVQL